MGETFLDGRVMLHCGDCRSVLAGLAPDSIDAVVTDPPYALGFMGKAWDHAVVAFDPALWLLVHRVLKPGGHLLAMGGTRTYHRLACAIEDAGFEVRDTISWLYGSGFPKSHDVSKGIDRAAGYTRGTTSDFRNGPNTNNNTKGDKYSLGYDGQSDIDVGPATDAARQWEGWGTSLKPAQELCCLARKPLSEGTVAANVLKWSTGAINIDGCRIGTGGDKIDGGCAGTTRLHNGGIVDRAPVDNSVGRWPANLIHDGSDEVTAAFPESGPGPGNIHTAKENGGGVFGGGRMGVENIYKDSGSAARFFYCAKGDADDRLGSKHPTVKPLDLMQWLVRLVTPKGGTVLDPFAGTGTTGEAAWREGTHAVLIEAEAEYQTDIRRRMALALAGPDERSRESVKAKGLPRDDGPLFSDWQQMWAKPFDFSQEPKGDPE